MNQRINKVPVIRLDTSVTLEPGIKAAAGVILAGGVVAYPTESFYGLGVHIADERAIHRLYSIKARPEKRPILLLISSADALGPYVNRIPDTAHRLMECFWPGGLTLVFEARSNISPLLTAHTGKIGIRHSSHPVAAALAGAVGLPITGTSANLYGQPPCCKAEAVLQALGKNVDLVLDAGETTGGKSSTVLDVTVDPPKVLREGLVGRGQLEHCLKRPVG
jgi:L-threonylcarbamoyladenylate synthase